MHAQISHLLIIILVLPVSSVYCERRFSAANHITTKLINRLTASSLDILLIFSIEDPSNKQFGFTRALALYKSMKQCGILMH